MKAPSPRSQSLVDESLSGAFRLLRGRGSVADFPSAVSDGFRPLVYGTSGRDNNTSMRSIDRYDLVIEIGSTYSDNGFDFERVILVRSFVMNIKRANITRREHRTYVLTYRNTL